MKCKRILSFIVVFVLATLILIVPTSAAGSRIIDRKGTLSDAETARVEQALADAEAATGVDFRAVIYNYSAGQYVGDDYRADYGYRNADDLCLLIVTYDGGWYYDLYTYGKAAKTITGHEVDLLLDDTSVYDNLKGGRIAEGLVGFAGVGAEMIREKHPTFLQTVPGALLLSSIIGLIVGGIAMAVVTVKYKTKLKSPSYPLSRYARLNLTRTEDVFIGKNTTRVRISSSSSSGGSSHGGGGGHRGGR